MTQAVPAWECSRMAKRWVLWVWSRERWTAVLSSRSEQSMLLESNDCNLSGLRTLVLPKGRMP